MLVTLLLVVAVVVVVYLLIKNITVLIVNAILGLTALVLINYFHVMQWIGKSDWLQPCNNNYRTTVGGLVGVGILVLLSILGITI